MDSTDYCEMCKAVRDGVPIANASEDVSLVVDERDGCAVGVENVTILFDDSPLQPLPAVRFPDGWIAWGIGGGWAHACSACAATLRIEGPVPS